MDEMVASTWRIWGRGEGEGGPRDGFRKIPTRREESHGMLGDLVE